MKRREKSVAAKYKRGKSPKEGTQRSLTYFADSKTVPGYCCCHCFHHSRVGCLPQLFLLQQTHGPCTWLLLQEQCWGAAFAAGGLALCFSPALSHSSPPALPFGAFMAPGSSVTGIGSSWLPVSQPARPSAAEHLQLGSEPLRAKHLFKSASASSAK